MGWSLSKKLKKALNPFSLLKDGWNSISGRNAAERQANLQIEAATRQQQEATRIANEAARGAALAQSDLQQRAAITADAQAKSAVSTDKVEIGDVANEAEALLRKRKRAFEFTVGSGVSI